MKDGQGIAQKMLEDGKINPKTIRLINEESFCKIYKKLPYEVDRMNSETYDYFLAIIRGRNQGEEKANPKK